jgi:3'(2'), 5'-bisphosphate nucleotidase
LQKAIQALGTALIVSFDSSNDSGMHNKMNQDLPQLLAGVRRIAAEAGAHIMRIYDQEFTVKSKDDESPLTAADLAAHRVIKNGLQALTPELPQLSEEASQIPFENRASWPTYWLIDPLDGTREFVKRNGEFTVNIALIEGHDVVLGVVAAPAKNLSYYAYRGHGAYKVVDGEQAARITTRKIVPQKPRVAGSRSHAGDSLVAFLNKLGEYELISMGSAFKLCLVAEGLVDIYPRFGPTSEWDTAAAQCVVEEAGGIVTDLKMSQLRYNSKESLLNPHFVVIGNPEHEWSRYL